MRKVWNTLVVLGILLCMVMSLGVTADAAEGDTAIFAVSGTQLSAENIDTMKTQYPDCLVVDVDGLADGQSDAGYGVVYADSEPAELKNYAVVWPGYAQMFYVGTQSRCVVLVGVNETVTADAVNAAVSAYLGDNPYVIAVGPASGAAVVAGCTDVDMFLTKDLEDTSVAGAVQVANVGKVQEAPVAFVKVNADGTASAEAIPVPQPVADPNVAPAEQQDETGVSPEEALTGVGPAEMPSEGENQPSIEEQPVGDVQPETEETPVTYCQIIYDGNGRTGGMVPDVLDFIVGSTHFLSQNGYVRDGYEFAGWTIDDDPTLYQPGDEVVIDHSVTVYAQWTEIGAEPVDEPAGEPETNENNGNDPAVETYTVTYKAGEGDGTDVAFSYNETDSKDIVLPDGSSFTPPEGKKFSGWLVEGTDEFWEGNTPYTVSGNVTFVAQYRMAYTVTYDFGESATPGYTDTVFEGESYGLAGEAVAEAPENKTFGGWWVNGELKAAGDQIVVTASVTVTAQWNDVNVSPAPVTEITVTYKSGVEGMDDVTVKAPADSSFTLPENPFTLPEGQAFLGWKQVAVGDEALPAVEGDGILHPGDTVNTAQTDLAFVAVTETRVKVTVTYLPGDGSDAKFEELTAEFRSGESAQYTLLKELPEGWTVPAGKTFGGWKIGDSTYDAGAGVLLKDNTTVTAVWNDVNKEKVDPASGKEDPTFTKGVDGKLEMSFEAKIDTVSMDGSGLTANSQYTVVENGTTSTISFDGSYLSSLTVGAHTLNITFVGTDTVEYTPYTRTLTVKEDPSTQNNEVTSIKHDWDRSQNLIIDFGQYNRGTPTKLEILRAYEKDESGNYKKDENGNYIPVWMELSKDKDYSISGTSMTFYPSLLGTWTNQQYGFRVTFDGAGTNLGSNTMLLYLNVTGTVPTTQPTATTAPTPTATPNGATSPATGDTNNVTLYIVILVVLIIALAAVLIIVMKRRSH